jgi:anti-anti-sigma factor
LLFTAGKERAMSSNGKAKGGDLPEIADGTTGVAEVPGKVWSPSTGQDERPRIRSKVIERVAIVRLGGSEFLFGEEAVRVVSEALERLVAGEGHARLVLNFDGVKYVSGGMLGELVALQEDLERRGGHLVLCGLDPLLRDLLRISHLDRIFDVSIGEADALGFLA